ncbi:MAG: hypothetical protein LBQ51_00985 [Desulfovibrio sp.]|jgi:hypothetical protein|nr:hypothetical protein [Desulfovibrio sp.]
MQQGLMTNKKTALQIGKYAAMLWKKHAPRRRRIRPSRNLHAKFCLLPLDNSSPELIVTKRERRKEQGKILILILKCLLPGRLTAKRKFACGAGGGASRLCHLSIFNFEML